jgi:hypothetical protein
MFCFKMLFSLNIFVADACISPFQTQTMHIKSTALLCFPKSLIPWRNSNPGLLFPEASRRQGVCFDLHDKARTDDESGMLKLGGKNYINNSKT